MVTHKSQLTGPSGLPLARYCFALLIWHFFIEVSLSKYLLSVYLPLGGFTPNVMFFVHDLGCVEQYGEHVGSVLKAYLCPLLSFLTSCLMHVQVHYWELGIPDCQGTVLAVPCEERLWWELRPRVIIAPLPFIPICETGDGSYGLGPNYVWMVWLLHS